MEALMQYVWQYRLWPIEDMVTVDGQRVDIIDVGLHNKNSGPDFFNAKVKIGDTLWSGNVEIHIKASDWMRHGHDKDPAYDSVVLHVVEVSDTTIHSRDGRTIPQMVMRCAPDFALKYHALVGDITRELPCARELSQIHPIYLSSWLSALAFERLQTKADRVLGILNNANGDWLHASYATIARALGFGTNSEPFEMLAMSTPVKYLMRHADDLTYIEAMLFGQAGLIPQGPTDDKYVEDMRENYRFLAAKYQLKPSQNIVWKMSRMRPQNFPHRRIAILAYMVSSGLYYMSRLIDADSEEKLRALFNINLAGYWVNHYTFGTASSHAPRAFSQTSITTLIINVASPILYAYGQSTGNDSLCERAVSLLESLAPERNSVVDVFSRAGIKADNAFTSQAMIQLRRCYCEPRKCLFCRVGHKLLTLKVKRI